MARGLEEQRLVYSFMKNYEARTWTLVLKIQEDMIREDMIQDDDIQRNMSVRRSTS